MIGKNRAGKLSRQCFGANPLDQTGNPSDASTTPMVGVISTHWSISFESSFQISFWVYLSKNNIVMPTHQTPNSAVLEAW
jgi:hypothetical protein